MKGAICEGKVAKRYTEISDKLAAFIARQPLFFVATAGASGRVNLSPKGMDSFRVLTNTRVAWLNVTGSGNETAAHVQENGRMTIMFAAFEGSPMILRLYGQARAVHKNDSEWASLYAQFKPLPGARQIFDLTVDLVQTSCGMGVPLLDHVGDRENLNDWATKQGDEGLAAYWEKKNQVSLDGVPTHILEKNR